MSVMQYLAVTFNRIVAQNMPLYAYSFWSLICQVKSKRSLINEQYLPLDLSEVGREIIGLSIVISDCIVFSY